MSDINTLFAQATKAYNQRDWRRALEYSVQALPQAPNHAELNYLAGLAALELQQMGPALEFLQRAVNLYPTRADYATQFAKALSMVNLSADAMIVADHALTLSSLDAQTLDTLGVIFTRANAHERATTLYERAVAAAPTHPNYRYNYAKSLVFLGRMDDAERELEACLALSPGTWGAHLTLSQLRRQTSAKNHVSRLLSLLPKSAQNPAAQMNLHLALAKEYEDMSEYATSFEHLVAGKAAGGSMRKYSPQHDEKLFDLMSRILPDMRAWTEACQTREPIFILGMPRTGTTLVERIISSHPDVHSAGELTNFALAFKRATGSRTPNLLDLETAERTQQLDWLKLGEDYLASTRPDTGHTAHFIDKLPHNFLYVGAIANALPNAKIICLRRDPMDSCLSNFRQLFALDSPNHDYSYDLLETGRYYVLFDRMMAHWKKTFPGRILEIDYETIVESQEASSRALIEFCELPWDDACLRFEENQAPATTASAVQVREPMYRGAMQRWKQYESQLVGLRQLLIDAGIPLKD
ncbi:sulfotransferase [Rhodanobacter sp. L36]|uniref:tetratricopeptide repeat-containing sulfotransferase family protein n=1 Tax=Rhodanobacter sp. L36 TaxID=1747221 RepID=UPI00131AF617|nr:sulfotransferase [Rhodanobacter sp. L36]